MFPYLTEKQKFVLHTAIWITVLYLVFRYLIPLLLPFLVAVLLAKLIRPVVRFLHKAFRIPMGWGRGGIGRDPGGPVDHWLFSGENSDRTIGSSGSAAA